MEQQRVWVPDPEEGFVLGRIVDIGLDEVTVQPNEGRKHKQTCSLDRLYTAEEHDNKDVDDNSITIAIRSFGGSRHVPPPVSVQVWRGCPRPPEGPGLSTIV
ncbi:Unconventional myosin-VI [Homalodisca vitripennis]|nr:Unconventional myosin-VI [Homalodisca vitripennis]